jgi:hypothetical protein
MPGFTSNERCLVLLELAEKIALEDPQRRKLCILHEDGRRWQVVLGNPSRAQSAPSLFPTLEQALEDFVLHWQRPWLQA